MTLASPTPELLAALERCLGPGGLRPPRPADLEDPRGRWQGRAAAVLRPADTDAVARAVRLAAEARVAIVPLGGGTGLVGGQLKPDAPDPLLLSLERMDRIRRILPEEDTVIVEAGVILADLQAAAEEVGRIFPLSLASQGSARIGGLLATNAGGVNVLRHGSMRALTLGLEAVLPDGSVLRGLSRLRKDNTGYDIRDLLVGSEGTLGVITAASLALAPRPERVGAALLAVPSPAAALALLGRARSRLLEWISAFELISGQGLRFLCETGLASRQLLSPVSPWSVLLEVGGPGWFEPEEALAALYADAAEAGLAGDGVFAASEGQRRALWELRERIPLANRRIGAIASHDIALPLAAVPEFLARAEEALARFGPVRVNCFGHLGDGNLHYNLFPPPGEEASRWRARAPEMTRVIHDLVHALGGSFAAEHGIGRFKTAELARYGDPVRLRLMRAIKQVIDPVGIMNPGVVLPDPQG